MAGVAALDGGDDEFCWLDFFALSEFSGTMGKKVLGDLEVFSDWLATRADVDLSVSVLLSVDDVSGVIGVRGGGGLLDGEGLLRVVPCAAHFASNLPLALEPGGLPTRTVWTIKISIHFCLFVTGKVNTNTRHKRSY